MKLDRQYQRELLQKLAEIYPHSAEPGDMVDFKDETQEMRYAAHMVYLEEHGLVNSGISFAMSGMPLVAPPSITAKGMDFIADDGGLSAILNVVTVKLHEDTIRELLISKIESADLTQQDRSSLKEAVRKLPAKALEKLTDKLLDLGADALVRESPQFGTWIDLALKSVPV